MFPMAIFPSKTSRQNFPVETFRRKKSKISVNFLAVTEIPVETLDQMDQVLDLFMYV